MVRSVAFQSAERLHTGSDSVRNFHRQQSRAFAPAPLTSAKCQVRCSPPGPQPNVARPVKLVHRWRFVPACCAALSVLQALRTSAAQGCRSVKHSGGSGRQALASTSAARLAIAAGSVFNRVMPSQGQKLPPNHSLNRTHCGMRLKALHFILGL